MEPLLHAMRDREESPRADVAEQPLLRRWPLLHQALSRDVRSLFGFHPIWVMRLPPAGRRMMGPLKRAGEHAQTAPGVILP
jgi:hypothetical protein